MDPSGLYFAISAYGNLNEENENYLSVNAFNNTINSIMRTDKSTLTIYNPHKEVDLFFKKKPNVSKIQFHILTLNQFIQLQTEPVKVILYEIGTGNLVGEIPSLFNIESFAISDEGKFITIGINDENLLNFKQIFLNKGSTSGIISIWSTCNEVRENIFEVLDQMKIKDDFWRDYPIYLDVKENVLEENNFDDDYHQRKDNESQNLDISVKSIQIGKNTFQKLGVKNSARYSLKEEASRIFDPKPQQQKQQQQFQQDINYQKARSMNFYDTQNKLQISSVGGQNDRNYNEAGNNDRFYRSKNEISANQKQFYTPQKDNHNYPQESIKQNQQRSSLTQEKLKEHNIRNQQLDQLNQRFANDQGQVRNIPKVTNIETIQEQQTSYPQNQYQNRQQQQQQQNSNQQQQRKSLNQPQQNNQSKQGNYNSNPREKFEEPIDIDDDVQGMPITQFQQNQQESPQQIGWRQQQQANQKQFQDQQFRQPLNNNIRNSQEFEIPSPSSIKQSQRSDSQFDSIQRFEDKLKNSKIQQSQFQKYN